MTEEKGELFLQAYDKYGVMLYRQARVYLRVPSDAEDALQEVFMRYLYKAPVFESEEHEKRWLLRVCANVSKIIAKRCSRVHKTYEGEGIASDPDNTLRELVWSLPPKYKDVIHLHYYEGYTVAETASILKISESAVKMRLLRGRRILKSKLMEVEML